MKPFVFVYICFFVSCVSGFANPSNPIVIEGQAEFLHPSSHELNIHCADKTIINWKDFSIDLGEITRFLQLSKHAVVLNRVTGNDMSALLGTLEANGHLFLLNPQGILIGKDAMIHVGGFTASTLNLSNEDFLNQEALLFKGTSQQSIETRGTIRATHGNITLIGRYVKADGLLQAPHGKVNIGCGLEILLKPGESENIYIRPQPCDSKEGTGTHTLGKIEAIQAELKSDGNAYAYAIKHEGEIDALGFEEKDGHVFLIAEGGKASVSGTIRSGKIDIFGKEVELIENALLDVSGERGGGSIFIKGSDLAFVDENVVLKANAMEHGNGGKILCLSDEIPYFYGSAEIRGGNQEGDGGFIEISGKKGFFYFGRMDPSAPRGIPGKLCLDPESNITISTLPNFNEILQDKVFTPRIDIANISIERLIEQLSKGPVLLTTHFEGEGENPGTIRITSDISHSYNSPYMLSLHSYGTEGVNIEGTLTNLGSGTIEILAPHGGVRVSPSTDKQTAHLETGGDLLIGTKDSPIGQAVEVIGAHQKGAELNTTGKGNLQICSKGGITVTSDSLAPATIHTENGTLDLCTSGSITITGQHQALAAIQNEGQGSINLRGLNGECIRSIDIMSSSGPAILTTSNRSGPLFICDVQEDLQIISGDKEAYIQGGPEGIFFKNIRGSLHLSTEKAPAFINTPGPIQGTILKDVILEDASITSLKSLSLKNGRDLILIAIEGDASLYASRGVNVQVGRDIVLSGMGDACASITGPGSSLVTGSTIHFSSNSHVNAMQGSLLLSAGTDILFDNFDSLHHPYVTAGSLIAHAGNIIHLNHNAQIRTEKGPNRITAGRHISLCDISQISASGGELSITASQGNIYLDDKSELYASSHPIHLKAGRNVILEGSAKMISEGETNSTIAVDQLHIPPDIEPPGGFILGKYASIETGEAPLHIFATSRSANSIEGKLNGCSFIPGPEYFDTLEEQWGANYTLLSLSPPFTIFYRDNGLVSMVAGGVTGKECTNMVINFAGPPTAELFRDLHPYDEFIRESIDFSHFYQGSDKRDRFFIRKRTFKHVAPPILLYKKKEKEKPKVE